MRAVFTFIAAAFVLLAIGACEPAATTAGHETPASETPDEFVARINAELRELSRETTAAAWVRATYITQDTAILAAKASERGLEFQSRAVEQARAFDGQELSEDAARTIHLLKIASPNPAPNDAAKRAELAEITTRMEGMYGEGKYCPDGPDSCKGSQELDTLMKKSRDYDEQLDAWVGWRTVSPPMRKDYVRFTELANEGARELGFENLGDLWRAGYDMSPAEFEAETERLWGQVEPLYEQLQCHVRARLSDHYGEDKVSRTGPIPAHLLGNMWAQQWSNIYDLIEPYKGVANLDVDGALTAQGYDAVRMTKTAENFFVSLGLPELPQTFWERSMLTKPRDREVVCHASAWPFDGGNDVRIKQCVEPNEDQLVTLHHELGHVYYFLKYKNQPPLYQTGANDGFHEAVGDTIQLSMTPSYLREIGLIDTVEVGEQAVINQQMKMALDKIAFLPFGKLIDQWRWDVFAGKITPDNYNAAWWNLRTKYQGIEAPVPRTEEHFDPGAKFHIPGNTPYTRYFLAHVLQFQFHKSLCEAAGFEGPLHACSVFGSKEAGDRLGEMLEMGASKPWPDALEKLTGSRRIDGGAIIEYFAPLMSWLEEQNEGRPCGWETTT